MECNDGVCEMIAPICPNPPCGGPPDIGPDTGVVDADAGDADAGDADADAGDADAGDADAGDADAGDADAGDADIGGGPDGSLAPFGEVWVGEVTAQQTTVRAFAQFEDRRSATYDAFSREYVLNGASCVLQRVTLLSGAPTPIEATSVEVDLNNGQILTYVSAGNGRYQPQFPPNPGIFGATPTPVDFTIVGGNQAGMLDDATATTDAPNALNPIAPLPLGNPIQLSQQLQWQPAAAQPNRRTIAELSDADGDVTLLCRIEPDNGTFTFPNDAVSDFMSQNPTTPFSVELRYEFAVATQVDIIPGTIQTLILFHTARGVRWPVQ
jgi:hypothetical protein